MQMSDCDVRSTWHSTARRVQRLVPGLPTRGHHLFVAGQSVYAAGAGTVVFAGVDGGYGNLVEIDHGDGIHTRYAHLHNFADGTTASTKVDAGQLIGFVGTTGSSTGNHLHFEVRKNGTPVDPLNSGIKIASTPETAPAEPMFREAELEALKQLAQAAGF